MESKVKIRISEGAYNKLLNILKGEEGHYVRFSYKDGCCGSSKIDMYIDSFKEGDTIDKIEGLSILYDSEVIENIKEITLVYRNSSFMIKTVTTKELFKNCSTCTVGCGSNGGCSHKNKMAIL